MNNQLQKLRTDRHLTQRELAEKSGISLRNIQHYEQGDHDISKASADTVLALAKALNTTMEEVIKKEPG